MSLLFALALCVSPSRAGVVMPVESGVAPAGPSAPVVPIVPGGVNSGPSLGGASVDLRGMLPLLPAPVPGLAGPRLNFVGDQSQAAAVQPQNAAAAPVASAPAPARSRAVRAADQKPTLPGKHAPGSSSPAMLQDRDTAKTPGAVPSLLSGPSSIEQATLENALPESASDAGRRFFDQSRDSGRGTLEDPSSGAGGDGDAASTGGREGSMPGGSRDAADGFAQASVGGGAFGGSRAPRLGSPAPVEGEILRDAVGAPTVPGGTAGAGSVSFFRSASPNGEALTSVNGPASSPPGAPSPLALDLSRSGLIVRVRSALGSVMPAPAAIELPARLPATAASTALLERGGLLEAFSAVDAYSGAEPGSGLAAPSHAKAKTANAVPAPRESSSSVPSPWLALLAVPLLAAAAARRFL